MNYGEKNAIDSPLSLPHNAILFQIKGGYKPLSFLFYPCKQLTDMQAVWG